MIRPECEIGLYITRPEVGVQSAASGRIYLNNEVFLGVL